MVTCKEVADGGLGEPKRQGGELFYHCPHPDRHNHGDRNPSLGVNPQKDVWKCGRKASVAKAAGA
jgi:hypothetical protein